MERSVSDAIKHGMNKLGYQNIRENQRHAVEAYFAGKDVFLCSPTGSGKSFVFEIAPFVLDYKNMVRGIKLRLLASWLFHSYR